MVRIGKGGEQGQSQARERIRQPSEAPRPTCRRGYCKTHSDDKEKIPPRQATRRKMEVACWSRSYIAVMFSKC